MDSQELIEKLSPFIKKHFLPLSLGLVGLIFLSYGLIVLIGGSKSASDEVVFEPGDGQVLNSSEAKITVDIEGAVLKPGVYNLSSDARLQEAIVASGGLSDAVDKEWVAKNLNLSQKLIDGAKIYIPKIDENTKESNMGNGPENLLKSQININKASVKELDMLSGIGLVTAQKIIDNRPYSTIDDLLSKKVVNNKLFERIKEKITVY